jgi:hypothetical protein
VFFDKWRSRFDCRLEVLILLAPGVGLEPAWPRRATGSQGQRINPLCHPGFLLGLMLFLWVLKYLCGCGVVGFMLVFVSQALIVAVCGCLLGSGELVGQLPFVCFHGVGCHGHGGCCFGYSLSFVV